MNKHKISTACLIYVQNRLNYSHSEHRIHGMKANIAQISSQNLKSDRLLDYIQRQTYGQEEHHDPGKEGAGRSAGAG